MSNPLNIKSAVLLSALIASANVSASVRVIDFDYDASGKKIENGQIIDNEYSIWGVNIAGCNYRGSGADSDDYKNKDYRIDGDCQTQLTGVDDQVQSAFDTSKSGTLDDDLEFVNTGSSNLDERYESYKGEQNNLSNRFYDPLYDYQNVYEERFGTNDAQNRHTAWQRPGNVLILHERADECSDGLFCGRVGSNIKPDDEGQKYAGFFVFEFATPVEVISLDFFDIEASERQIGRTQNTTFFFLDGQSTPTEQEIVNTDDGGYERVTYANMFNVTRLVVNLPGSGAINNLVFRQTQVSAPATLGLLAGTLALFGIRRRLS